MNEETKPKTEDTTVQKFQRCEEWLRTALDHNLYHAARVNITDMNKYIKILEEDAEIFISKLPDPAW